MKILIIRMYPTKMTTNNYNVQEIGLAKALVKKGHVCDIVSYNGDDDDEIRKIKLEDGKVITNYCLKGKNKFKNCFFSDKIYDIIKEYDIIQTEEYDQLQNLQLLKKSNKPLILYHGPYYNKFNKYNLKYNLKCKLYDLLFLNNKKYKEIKVMTKSELAKKFLVNKKFKYVQAVGVGLDIDKFNNCNKIEIKNDFIVKMEKYKKEKNIKYLLYIGKIEKRRNIKFLIDLFYSVNKRNENVKLILVGKGNEKYIKEIFNYAKKLNVYDNIYYNEKIEQDEIAKLYEIANIFLLPTEYEIFGMVMLEAMYMGIPLITTLNGGSSTLIDNKINGYICENNNVEQWRDTILKILDNQIIYNNISQNASNKIKNEFTWDKIAEKFILSYNEIISKYNNQV